MSETQNETTLEVMQAALDGVQEQIRFADSKATFVGVFHTFLFGFIFSQADELSKLSLDRYDCGDILRILLLIAYAVTTLVSIVYTICTVLPKFGQKAPKCKIFFGHIVSTYGRDYDRYVRDAINASEADWLRDIGTQIVENSNIAMDKHKRARTAAKWTVAAVVSALLLAGSVFFSGSKSDATNTEINKHSPAATTTPVIH